MVVGTTIQFGSTDLILVVGCYYHIYLHDYLCCYTLHYLLDPTPFVVQLPCSICSPGYIVQLIYSCSDLYIAIPHLQPYSDSDLDCGLFGYYIEPACNYLCPFPITLDHYSVPDPTFSYGLATVCDLHTLLRLPLFIITVIVIGYYILGLIGIEDITYLLLHYSCGPTLPLPFAV